jgi:D-amino-acid dehydrogenase
MRIVILGSGVIGVSLAWRLRKDGHAVTVVDNGFAAAHGASASHANAGQLSYSYSSPWAAPGVPFKALKWMFQKHGPFRFSPEVLADSRTRSWLFSFLRNCKLEAWNANRAALLALAQLSREALLYWKKEMPDMVFDHGMGGTLEIVEGHDGLQSLKKTLPSLERAGIPYSFLDTSNALLKYEPGLQKSKISFSGGLHMPLDGTGDARMFAEFMLKKAETSGVRVMHGHRARHAIVHAGRVIGVVTEFEGRRNHDIPCDILIVCLGAETANFVAGHGVRLPIIPVQGFSLTAPVNHYGYPPVSTVMHERMKVATTRLGLRVRVGGTAALRGFAHDMPKERLDALRASAQQIFPNGAEWDKAVPWTGLRPMTPDGRPRMGKTHVPGLWVCSGHGTLGWTLATGSAEMIAHLILGKSTPIDSEPFRAS